MVLFVCKQNCIISHKLLYFPSLRLEGISTYRIPQILHRFQFSRMGKQKRSRQKYHLASVRWKKEEAEAVSIANSPTNASSAPIWSDLPNVDNIFSGIKIDVTSLKTSFDTANEDDTKSLGGRSIAKSLRMTEDGRHMKKQDRRRLKHALFIQRIDDVYKEINRKSKDKKKSVLNITATKVGEGESIPVASLTEIKESDCTSVPVKSPQTGRRGVYKGLKKHSKKSIEKTKVRFKNMVNDIENLKKILSETTQLADPLNTVTSKVEKNVFEKDL